jgi:hypothetical protein
MLHEQEVLRVVARCGLVVERGARQSEQLALPDDGQRGMVAVDERTSLLSGKRTFFSAWLLSSRRVPLAEVRGAMPGAPPGGVGQARPLG